MLTDSIIKLVLLLLEKLKDVALVDCHIVYMKLGNDLSLLNFKMVAAKL